MILQALYQLAEREQLIDDPDFEPKSIRWLIQVGSDGKFLGFQDTNHIPPEEEQGKKTKKKPKPTAKTFVVPRDASFNMRTGTNNYCGPLFDKREFVFGIPEANYKGVVNEERAATRREIFRERARSILSATGDEGVAAAVAFLDAVAEGRGPAPPEDCGPGDLFAFAYAPDADRLVTDREAVRAWWKRERASEESGQETLQCLVTGKSFADPDLFPKIKHVPGVQGDVSLISFNARAFESYGLSSNENAPISREAAESIATALTRLLHPAYPVPLKDPPTLPRRAFRISADTAFCYWSAGGDAAFEDVLDAIFAVDESVVKEEVWRRLWAGKPPDTAADLTPFYGLVITGQTGRAILREWFETTLAKAQHSIARHFADLAIVRNAPWKKGEEPPVAIGLRTLLESIAEQGKQENIPATLASQFVRAALTGCMYPFGLLVRAVERARAEIGSDDWMDLQRRDARAAIIKAVLNRRQRLQPSNTFKEVTEEMDPNNRNPGYVLGCLMAVLERLQQEALGDVNATVVDKHFSGASAAPRATFDRLVKNARHHAKKARDNERGGLVIRLERLIDELMSAINVDHEVARKVHAPIGFPLTLPIEQQGLFVIGYHHMRHFLWLSADRRAEWEEAHPDAPPAFAWQSKKLAEVSS